MPTRELVAVEAYAGGSYPVHPRAVTWRGRRYEVETIEQQRRKPQGLFFLVRCQGGPRLTLHYDDLIDAWWTEVPVTEEFTSHP